MNTVVIVDNDSKQIITYKRMLEPYGKEMDCMYFQYPGQALDYMMKHPPAVLVCELDLPDMSGKEVFDMVEMLSPSTIKIAMSRVTDVPKTLDIMNHNRVLKLIIKPFFLVEDIAGPIQDGLSCYEQQEKEEIYQRSIAVEMEMLNKQEAELRQKLEEKKQSYASIYNTAVGIVRANLRYGRVAFSEEESRIINQVFEGLFQEFMRYYMFEARNYIFHANYLKNMFHRPEEGSTFQMKNKCTREMENSMMQQIAYTIFMSGYLCSETLREYQAAIILGEEPRHYVVKLCYQFSEEGQNFKIKSSRARKVMICMVQEIINAISDKVVRSDTQNLIIAKVYFRKEEGTV